MLAWFVAAVSIHSSSPLDLSGYIAMLAVDNSFRKRGIGSVWSVFVLRLMSSCSLWLKFECNLPHLITYAVAYQMPNLRPSSRIVCAHTFSHVCTAVLHIAGSLLVKLCVKNMKKKHCDVVSLSQWQELVPWSTPLKLNCSTDQRSVLNNPSSLKRPAVPQQPE